MSTPTPAELRAEFERQILTDLLGPSRPDEALPGVRTPVRQWYLVGMLAPKGTIVDPNRGDDDDLPGDDEGGAPGRDGQPAKVVLFPSSIGFTAAVEASCSSLTVAAAWAGHEKRILRSQRWWCEGRAAAPRAFGPAQRCYTPCVPLRS